MVIANNKFILAGAGIAALVVLYLVKKKGAAADAGLALGSALGGFAYGVTDGAVSGVVYGVGDAIGLPRTSETECEKAKREGRTWDASFVCPAGDFLSYFVGPPVPAAPAAPAQTTPAMLPWDAPDPVGNNDYGMNFNYF